MHRKNRGPSAWPENRTESAARTACDNERTGYARRRPLKVLTVSVLTGALAVSLLSPILAWGQAPASSQAADTQSEPDSPQVNDAQSEPDSSQVNDAQSEPDSPQVNDAQSVSDSSQTAQTRSASSSGLVQTAGTDKTVTLRVCSWEEYIDTGDWEEDEVIDLDSGDIFGENSLVEDFETWYYDTYGVRVNVEYSTFGTNEDLYNMLTLGDVYDLVCPSEYMIMKLMSEDQLLPLSEHFFDENDANNYYVKGVSNYIRNIFETKEINGEPWSRYAAGFMWGITGIVYNPDVVTQEEASTWTILDNRKFNRQITIKDNVRDSYFAAVGALKSDLLTSEAFINDPDYAQNLENEMNDTTSSTIAQVQDYLQDVKNNVYSFETDSGKADMITGKVVANYQWSGDAVFTMDQADEDDYTLNFAVPVESTNIYFDGWVMLRRGIGDDADKQQAAEAFINFMSRPDNVIRNMYFIGYTSVISGGEDSRIFEYLDWNYGAKEDETDTVEYDVSYFFSEDDQATGEYVLTVPEAQTRRQLGAQYPSADSIRRSSIMIYFNPAQNKVINQMWVNVRCFNIEQVPVWVLVLILGGLAALIVFSIRRMRASRA